MIKGGKVSGELSSISIGGKEYLLDIAYVYFDGEGKVIQMKLAGSMTIEGKEYEKGTWIQLYNDGSFASASDKEDEKWTGVKQ